MKKIIAMLLCLATVFSFAACSNFSSTDEPEETEDPKQVYAEMENSLQSQPLYVTKAEVYRYEEDNEIYLTANIKNASDKNISSFVLSFAAWDAEGNPIIIKSASGETQDQFVKKCNFAEAVAANSEWIGCYDDVNGLFGLQIDPSLVNITYVKATVYSYTDESGTETINPFYYTWENTHLSEKLEDYMMPVAQ